MGYFEENNDMDFLEEEEKLNFVFKEMQMIEQGSSTDENIDTEENYADYQQMVNGSNIDYEEIDTEEQRNSILNMMKNVNSHNQSTTDLESERLLQEQRAREEADKRKREEARLQLLQQRSEEEARERNRIRQAEDEEEARLLKEAEEKRQSNPLYKIKQAAIDLAEKQKIEAEKKKQEKLEKQQKEEQEDIDDNINSDSSNEKEVTDVKEKSKENKVKKNSGKNKKPDYEFLATHDQLTGMKNFTAYDLAVKSCDPKHTIILFIDINDLKYTNDTFGHAAGNKLITTVSTQLDKMFPDSVYRIGGDEFVVLLESKKINEVKNELDEKILKLHLILDKESKKEESGLVYSVSIGYAVGDKDKTISEIQELADKLMYENKQKYKEKKKKNAPPVEKKEEKPPVDHDSLLPDDQRLLKEVIKENHNLASVDSTEKILREIQQKRDEVIAILIADAAFDHLFILQDVDSFLDLITELDNAIDYSYIYAVYENGTQFYGIDEYFDEVTMLFSEVGNVIKSSPYVSDKELLKIKGINIFKNIYID